MHNVKGHCIKYNIYPNLSYTKGLSFIAIALTSCYIHFLTSFYSSVLLFNK